jgi:gliding motility-associated-like protein
MKNCLPALIILAFFASSCNRSNEDEAVCALSNGYNYGYYGVRFPSAFTPNGDGRNDAYRPVLMTGGSRQINSFSMNITDRDGTILYQTSVVGGDGWDGRNTSGTPMAPGRYVARFTIRTSYGETISDNVCIGLMNYNGASCIPRSADGEYVFEDMINPNGGMYYNTAESICP